MRQSIRAFLALAESVYVLQEPVVEFGSYQVGEAGGAGDLRPLFPGKKYIGCDMRPGPGVDRVENVEAAKFGDGEAGSVVFVDTIEHVRRPEAAVREIFRVLKPGGVLVMASVMDFPIHNHPHDYWRFTPEGFKSLLSVFPQCAVGSQGFALHPHTVFGLGFKTASAKNAETFRLFESRAQEIGNAAQFKPYKKKLAFALAKAFPGGYFGETLQKYSAFDEIRFEFTAGK
jgi:SAM-dependent methyltransferase